MVQENEIIMFVLGLGVFIFILANYSRLKRIPSIRLLITGYCLFLAGWSLTILETFYWPTVLNYLEHISYAAGAIIMAVWSWKVFAGPKESR
jgi:hypothetical protein